MSHHEQIFQAILENPEDDALRLVYADWLEEHGNTPRAEFIRVQIELANCSEEDDTRRMNLEQRENELLRKHARRWKAETRAPAGIKWDGVWKDSLHDFVPFRRGFLCAALVRNLSVFEKKGAELFHKAPVEDVRFDHRVSDLARFLKCPSLERLAGLSLTASDLDVAQIRLLASTSRLPRLRRLDVSLNYMGDQAVTALAEAALRSKLECLELGSNRLTDDAVAALRGSPVFFRIKDLGLVSNGITDSGALLLLDFPRIVDIALNGNPISAAWLEALAGSPLRDRLRRLYLGGTRVGDAAVEHLAQVRGTLPLTHLDLGGCNLSPRGIEALVSSSALQRLHELDLGLCTIGMAGARALANWPAATRLRVLRLGHCDLTDREAKILASSPYLSSLHTLDMMGNPLSDKGRAALKDRFGERVYLNDFSEVAKIFLRE
jgi:uncharacterized protein (TIGR02996 family)